MPVIHENLYCFRSCKDYLLAGLDSEGGAAGTRTQLANHLNCQSGYISQVLKGDRHFSEEHLLEIAQYYMLNEAQTEYFLLLGKYERAGSVKLKDYYEKKLTQLRLMRQRIPQKDKKSITDVELARFHAHWFYYATYMLLKLNHGIQFEKVAKTLDISPEQALQAYDFLEEFGVIKKVGQAYQVSELDESIGRNSPYVNLVHKNFRIEAIKSLDKRKPQDAHYSRYFLASEERAALIQEEAAEFVIRVRDLVAEAENSEQRLYSFSMDCFRY